MCHSSSYPALHSLSILICLITVQKFYHWIKWIRKPSYQTWSITLSCELWTVNCELPHLLGPQFSPWHHGDKDERTSTQTCSEVLRFSRSMSNLMLGVSVSTVPISHKNACFMTLCYRQLEFFQSYAVICSKGEDEKEMTRFSCGSKFRQ